MTYPAWGTASIKCGKRKCGKRKCGWRGKETDLVDQPHPEIKGATKKVCPKCGCDSYQFVEEKGKK